MNDLVSVKFLEHYGTYNIGEVAGFKQHIADDLVNDGIAKYNRGKGRPIGSRSRNKIDPSVLGGDWVDKGVVTK